MDTITQPQRSIQATNIIDALTAIDFKDRTNFCDYTLSNDDLNIINNLSDIIPVEVSLGIRYGFRDLTEIAHSNMKKSNLNSRSIVVFLYYLALNHKQQLLAKYPFVIDDLIPIFTQLGISSNIKCS